MTIPDTSVMNLKNVLKRSKCFKMVEINGRDRGEDRFRLGCFQKKVSIAGICIDVSGVISFLLECVNIIFPLLNFAVKSKVKKNIFSVIFFFLFTADQCLELQKETNLCDIKRRQLHTRNISKKNVFIKFL